MIFFFHTGRGCLMVPVFKEDGTVDAYAGYHVGILRQLGWHVDDVAMFRLPRFPENKLR